MSDDGQVSKRRVYDLPVELVDRITAFQLDKKLPSEVEAVRRLLDEALKHRDTPELIVERIKDRLAVNGLIHAVGNDVLREHPLVSVIDQGDPEHIGFTMKSGRIFRVDLRGNAQELDPEHNGYGEPDWLSFPYKPKAIPKRSDHENDDEIPF